MLQAINPLPGKYSGSNILVGWRLFFSVSIGWVNYDDGLAIFLPNADHLV